MRTDRFTEGTDLFSKGDLVYTPEELAVDPIINQQLQKNETIIENPSSVDLINALKVLKNKRWPRNRYSKRGNKRTFATIENKDTKKQEEKRLNLWQIKRICFRPALTKIHLFHLSTQMLLETEVFVMEMYLL
jgi:hypothetical protein